MYLYTTVQVSGHVFVYYGWSERLYICMNKYMTAILNVVYKYMTAHLNRSIQIHDLSVEP
jgi:hypothetical protein